MVYGLLNQGSGAGNQLFRYIALRIKALELGVDYRMIWNPDGSGKPGGFKCKDFMFFDESKVGFNFPKNFKVWHEKKITDSAGTDICSYDPEWNFIEDGTLLEGELQDERYWEHREREVNEWLKVEPLEMPDDLCVIGFRGGEFALYPDLFLTKEYWQEAIGDMIVMGVQKFEVHTDDPVLAKEFFVGPIFGKEFELKIIHDIGINWRSMRYAKYAIIANSSFFILPRWLNKGVTIAPRYWGRRNTKVWSLPQNYYKRFTHI